MHRQHADAERLDNVGQGKSVARLETALDRAVLRLATFIREAIDRGLDPVRVARAGHVLLLVGCSRSSEMLGITLPSYIAAAQQEDGGWSDVEETAWCIACLTAFGEPYAHALSRAIKWLRSQRLVGGGWGRTSRDRARIPITGLLSALVPNAVDTESRLWVGREWNVDLSGQVPLTYKGAFYLLSRVSTPEEQDGDLINRTVCFLVGQQGKDGGFAPWKGHPLGSDPWSTGAALWGLAGVADLVPTELFRAATAWAKHSQLPDGSWPYHYPDEGTAMALIGLSSVRPYLNE